MQAFFSLKSQQTFLLKIYLFVFERIQSYLCVGGDYPQAKYDINMALRCMTKCLK